MKRRSKAASETTDGFWAAVAKCMRLFPHSEDQRRRIDVLRKKELQGLEHLDPIDVVKDILGLKAIPADVLAKYRAQRNG